MDGAREAKFKPLEVTALLAAVGLYFAMSCAIAEGRLFWYDEIFTRQVADLGSWNRIVAALHHGIDLQPPLFYLVTRWTRYGGGEEIGLRLPAMAGFTFTGFALYVVGRRWLSPGYATAAAVTPWIIWFTSLGVEARPYGLVLGCAALALLGWTFRDRRPVAGRIAYLTGILGAASTHYYGFTIAAPFGIAALWTLVRKRRLELWTLLGCLCAVAPNLWNLQFIREDIAMYREGAWNPPSGRGLISHAKYGTPLAVLGAVLLVYVLSRLVKKGAAARDEDPPGDSVACWLGFTAIPILAIVIAKATSGLFSLRYYSMYSLGYGLLLAFLLQTAAKGSRLVGYLAGCGALLAFGFVVLAGQQQIEKERDNVSQTCDYFGILLDRSQYRQSRLLIGDPHIALQLALYCDDLRNRMVFGADPANSLRYSGANTDHKALLQLRENPVVAVTPLDEVLRGAQHPLVVYHAERSFLKEYFSDRPEYNSRLHVLKEGRFFTVYWLDPPAGGAGGVEAN